ncbi:MAG: hypothetical protein AVDCRST_MAG35-1928, partial [uncultured Quadrisphaera sp.]
AGPTTPRAVPERPRRTGRRQDTARRRRDLLGGSSCAGPRL